MNAVLFVVLTVVVLLAWALTGRRREYRPIALLLSAGLVSEAAHQTLRVLVLVPLQAELGTGVPWTGWARAAGVLSDSVWLIWPAALVAVSLAVFVARPAWPALAGWACVVWAIAVLHPIGWALALVMHGADTLAIGTALVLLGLWCRRHGPLRTSASCMLAGLVLFEVASKVLSSRVGEPIMHGLLFISIAMFLGYHLFRQKALEVQHDVLRAHGAARDAAECSASTARALASAVRIAEDQRQQEREANARAAADAAIAIADERRANWDLRDESEFAREVRRREAKDRGFERDPDPNPSGPRRR